MLFILLTALCFSIGGICIKLIPWSVFAMNGARNLLGAMVVGIFLLVTHHRIRISMPVIIGAVCTMGVTTFFIIANKLTTAANSIILQYTAPVFVIIFMAAFFHVLPSRQDIVTCIVVFIGVCIFFVDGLNMGNIKGNLAALVSGVFYAGVLMMNTAEKSDVLSSSFLGQLSTGIIFTPFCIYETDFSTKVIILVMALGIIQVGLAYVFFSIGIHYTKPLAASFILSLEPILNPLWVALFYGETISPVSAVGAVIVFVAVLRYNIRSQKQNEKAAITE